MSDRVDRSQVSRIAEMLLWGLAAISILVGLLAAVVHAVPLLRGIGLGLVSSAAMANSAMILRRSHEQWRWVAIGLQAVGLFVFVLELILEKSG